MTGLRGRLLRAYFAGVTGVMQGDSAVGGEGGRRVEKKNGARKEKCSTSKAMKGGALIVLNGRKKLTSSSAAGRGAEHCTWSKYHVRNIGRRTGKENRRAVKTFKQGGGQRARERSASFEGGFTEGGRREDGRS